jgi:hypothetical protein
MKQGILIVVLLLGQYFLAAQTMPPDTLASAEFSAQKEGKGLRFKASLPPLGQKAGAAKAFYRYHWEFGDGHFSTEESPYHEYTREGNYNALLCATNAYDDKNPPKDKKKDIYAPPGGMGINREIATAMTSSYQGIALKNNRDARPGETFIVTLSYQNRGKESTSGRLYLFYNEKVFKKGLFEYQEGRTHFGEQAVPPDYTLSDLPVEAPRWTGVYRTSSTGAALQVLSDDPPPPPPSGMVEKARSLYRDEQNWLFKDLAAGEKRNLFVTLRSTENMLKDTTALIHIQGIFIPDNPQLSAQDFTLEMKIVNSHDPNAISVSDIKVNYRNLTGNDLDYRVDFQNNGEGPAKQISIVITMPKGLKLGEMRPLEWYPKCPLCPKTPTTASCLDTSTTDGQLIFTFKNIALPGSRQKGMDYDSTKGFIRYRMEADKHMPKRTFKSQARIIFDKNPPIYTNYSQTRFKPGISPGPKFGYEFHPDTISGGNLFIGISLSPFKSWKIYPQLELLTGFQSPTELRATNSTQVYSDTLSLDFYTDSIVQTTQGGNRGYVSFEVPLLFRKNLCSWLGFGAGGSARVLLYNGTRQTTTRSAVQRYIIETVNPLTYLPFGDPVKYPPTTTLSSFRDTRLQYTLFADCTLGAVRAGPNLGLRAGYILGSGTPRFFLQASVEVKL